MVIVDWIISILSVLSTTQCGVFFRHKVYSELHKVWPCIARSNGTHVIGCSSSRYGNVGVLHFVIEGRDIDWVLESAPMNAYIVVISFRLFDRDHLEKMNTSSKIQGIIVIATDEKSRLFPQSPEYVCPNPNSGLDGTCDDVNPWNEVGDGILWEWWNMPIFYSDDYDTISEMYSCFKKFNSPLNSVQGERSLCALELTSYMHARGLNSEMCLKRRRTPFGLAMTRFCEKLGDVNLVVPVIPFELFGKKKYIVLAARLDSATFFYGRTPAAASTVTSLVTTVLAAKLLNELVEGKNVDSFEKNVLFVFFNGEAYDYIGSSRFAYDLRRGIFPDGKNPIVWSDIVLYVELAQIMLQPTLFVHTDSVEFPEISKFLDKFNSTKTTFGFTFDVTRSSRPFPPSSMHSFLKYDRTFPGMVISSYDDSFLDNFYHSVLDDTFNIKYNYNETNYQNIQTLISNISTTLAYTVYELMVGDSTQQSIVVNATKVDKLLQCYVNNFRCDLFGELGFLVDDSKIYPNFYVGKSVVENSWFVATKYLLMYFMSKVVGIKNEIDCTNPKTRNFSMVYNIWDDKNKNCRVTNVGTTLAVSPAFVIDNYDMKSFNYSTWSESTWDGVRIRLFLQPTAEYELQAVVFGGVILYFSFIFVYFLNNRAEILFVYSNRGGKRL